MNSTITYEPGTISLTVVPPEQRNLPRAQQTPYKHEQEATIAYDDSIPTGLAYITHCSDDGELSYGITHIASELDLCTFWEASTEEEVQKWITELLKLADWTERKPRPTANPIHLLRYAVIGVLYDLIQQEEAKEKAESYIDRS